MVAQIHRIAEANMDWLLAKYPDERQRFVCDIINAPDTNSSKSRIMRLFVSDALDIGIDDVSFYGDEMTITTSTHTKIDHEVLMAVMSAKFLHEDRTYCWESIEGAIKTDSDLGYDGEWNDSSYPCLEITFKAQ